MNHLHTACVLNSRESTNFMILSLLLEFVIRSTRISESYRFWLC